MDKQQAILLIKNHMAHHGIGNILTFFLGEALNMAIEGTIPAERAAEAGRAAGDGRACMVLLQTD